MSKVISNSECAKEFLRLYRNYPDSRITYRELFRQVRKFIKWYGYRPTVYGSPEMVKLENDGNMPYFRHIQHSMAFISNCVGSLPDYEIYKYAITNKSVILEMQIKR